MLLAVELFGRSLPEPGFAVVVFVLIALFFLINRSSPDQTIAPNGPRQSGTGRQHECQRCGRRFQPERVELLSSGDVRRWIDDHCPGCGWDIDRGEPNKPGGAGARW
jgi:hypothetical protein